MSEQWAIYNADCLEILPTIKDKSIDLILTDPPYGTTDCKWDSIIPFEPMWKELKRIIKDNGAIVLFGSEPFSSALRMSNIKGYKYDWIWNKVKGGNFANLKYQPYKTHEIISVFSNNTHVYYPIKTPQKERTGKVYSSSNSAHLKYKDDKQRVYKERYPKSILKFSNANQIGKQHPTQKPVDLLEYLIKTYTNEGETVLDFAMGSGSTGVACKHLNREFIGIEKDEKYFKIAKERINCSDNIYQEQLFKEF